MGHKYLYVKYKRLYYLLHIILIYLLIFFNICSFLSPYFLSIYVQIIQSLQPLQMIIVLLIFQYIQSLICLVRK